MDDHVKAQEPMRMNAFFTRDRANEGRRLPLTTPDGQPTEHWLQVRSQHSDAFRERADALLQAAANDAPDPKNPNDLSERQARGRKRTAALRAALVCAWSFPEDCTPEAVERFLEMAPQIAAALDRFAGDDRIFFAA